ncbi:22412_t:CDS:2 [Rhizophagus irregularis]|nr:22412_t:CDS:2 [Rhizophagus irregularis]
MKFFSKNDSISRSRLLKYAVYVCIFTILWNIAEGAVSIFYGSEDDSVSLVFFGVDSFIEVTSACLVLWRFLTESKPDEERATQILEENLSKEKKCTMGIGLLFILLSLATISDATVSLIQKRQPETAIAGLIISSISLSFMGFLWLSKKYLAKMLNSSTMASEAQCSLACIKITFILFLGSLLYMIWKGGWWLDSAAAIILGVLFAKEGVDMILWARSKDFNGEDIQKEKNLDCCSNNEIFNEKSEKCCEGKKQNTCCDKELEKNEKENDDTKKNTCCDKELEKNEKENDETKKQNTCCDKELEKNEKENDETKKNTCCDKELKDSIEVNVKDSNDKELNVEIISKPEDAASQDKIEVVKTEEKGSNCACCH